MRKHAAPLVLAVLVLAGSMACAPVARPAAPEAGSSVLAARPAATTAPAAARPAAAQRSAAPPAADAGAANASEASQVSVPWDRMVIRTARLALQVEDVEASIERVREIARVNGGYVGTSNTSFERLGTQERMVADMTLQVRTEVLDTAIAALRRLATKVETEAVTSQDVTEEYVDLESSLRNLKAAEEGIRRLIDRTTRIEEVLSLQRELTNVRAQIERIEGRKRFLERRTEMATVTVSLRLPPPEVKPVGPLAAWDPVAQAGRGWEGSLVVLRGIADTLILVVSFGWWLLPLAALAVFVVRSRRPRSAPPVAAGGAA